MNNIPSHGKEIKQTLAYVLLAIGSSVWMVGTFGQLT